MNQSATNFRAVSVARIQMGDLAAVAAGLPLRAHLF